MARAPCRSSAKVSWSAPAASAAGPPRKTRIAPAPGLKSSEPLSAAAGDKQGIDHPHLARSAADHDRVEVAFGNHIAEIRSQGGEASHGIGQRPDVGLG